MWADHVFHHSYRPTLIIHKGEIFSSFFFSPGSSVPRYNRIVLCLTTKGGSSKDNFQPLKTLRFPPISSTDNKSTADKDNTDIYYPTSQKSFPRTFPNGETKKKGEKSLKLNSLQLINPNSPPDSYLPLFSSCGSGSVANKIRMR